MVHQRHSDEGSLKLLREIKLELADGPEIRAACCSVGVHDATCSSWCRFGGVFRSQLSELRSLEKYNAPLKRIMAPLELDRQILKHNLSYPRAWRRVGFVGPPLATARSLSRWSAQSAR